MPTAQPDLTLTPQQEAAFVYRQEQDPDWWPALLCQHVTSQGDTLAALKAAILADPEEWNPVVARAKANGMGAVRKLAGEKLRVTEKELAEAFEMEYGAAVKARLSAQS